MTIPLHQLPSVWKGERGFELFKNIWNPFLKLKHGKPHLFRFYIDKKKEDAFCLLIETPKPFRGRIWIALNNSPYAIAVGQFGGIDLAVKPNVGFEDDILGDYLLDGWNLLKLKYEGCWLLRDTAEIKSLFGYRNFEP